MESLSMTVNIFDLVFETVAAPARPKTYAVVDVETTGLFPKHDRVVEIAVIICDDQFEIIEQYETLINPNRDMGPTTKHGITAAMVKNAPTFSDVAGDIAKRLAGRTLLGHNVQFDAAMISAEFARLDVDHSNFHQLCTLRLAHHFINGSRKLEDCCAHHEIELSQSHRASADALATLHLVRKFKILADQESLCFFTDLKAFKLGKDFHHPVSLKESKLKLTRDEVKDVAAQRESSYIGRLLSKLSITGSLEMAPYYNYLEIALEDRRISEAEILELERLAVSSGLSQTAIWEAHREILRSLVKLALQDAVITDAEMDDLKKVNSLLGFEEGHTEELIAAVRCSMKVDSQPGTVDNEVIANAQEFAGLKVCFTGETACRHQGKPMSRALCLELAQKHGLIATDSVTKSTDILVLADPDSMSGKAKKARQYGIRLMADRVFWQKLGEPVA
jgi:DNA polymerase-3 subunit epsilon